MPYSQEGRLISLTTPLGVDKLLLAGFSGHEAISRLFSFHLDLLSEKGPIDFTQIIGKNVTISITQSHHTPRYFNGMVSHFAESGSDARLTHYRMEVVPWTWMLTRYADCKIFHNKTVAEIVQKVFGDRGFSDYKLQLNGTYSPMEYCVQYRETDFNFISRLMEQNGIFYFYQHEMGKHTMVIADSSSVHESCPGQENAGYNLVTGGIDEYDVVNSWNIEQELRSGKYTLTDYNFKTPSANLTSSEATVISVGGNDKFEIFDFPGDYTTRTDGTAFAKLRMQEEEAGHLVANGSSVCRAFTTGYKFKLTDHYEKPMNVSYVLTEIQHTASVGSAYSTGGGRPGESYSNHFTCIPLTVPFRPARLTPKPFVQGPQTAVVIGKSSYHDTSGDDGGGDGEEIWVDSYGRVIVRFPWDRAGSCSCRVRVSQEWAGQSWGAIHIPRVGQEVIVSFLEGDPDRPIITGRVYNAEQMPPYKLPDNQTQSGVKSHSSKGGTADNFNEIRLEDKKGSEDLLIHAERTMHNSVEASQFITVGGDRHITTGGVDKDGNKLGDVKELVFKNHNLHVKTDDRIKIEGKSDLHVQGQANTTYDKDLVQSITGKCVIVADTIQLQGNTKIVLMAGSSSIVIDASGVTVLGAPFINLNTPGAPPAPEIAPPAVDPDDP
jgi:type VI secretion system secreted protein VgrG